MLWLSVLALAVVLVGLVVWLSQLTPSHQGNWQSVHEKLPIISLHADQIAIQNVRDFRYSSPQNPSEPRWIEQGINITEVSRLWFALSHFADRGMAHSLISFEFTDGTYLALSIEARLEQGQEYDPVLGLFRQFEMIYLFGTEQDLIGLRSAIRKEPIFLYPLALPKKQVQALLWQLLTSAQQQQQQPAFYNTVFNNCLTHLLRQSQQFSWWELLTDWRLLVPGYSYQVAQERGWLPAESEPAIQEYRIDPAISPDDPAFSTQIRAGCPHCEPYHLP